MRYYYAEHEAAYRRLAEGGLTQWNDLFEDDRTRDFDAFPNRGFLEGALARLDLRPSADVLEYGCGTGAAACFLAARGLRVDAIRPDP